MDLVDPPRPESTRLFSSAIPRSPILSPSEERPTTCSPSA